MHTVYLIQNSSSKEIYIGQTNNLTQRLQQHNRGANYSTHRKKDGEGILVYVEAYRVKEDATNREAKLKQRGSAKYCLFKRIVQSFQAQR